MTVDAERVLESYGAAIARAAPTSTTLLSGSALLGEFGGHDIDLVVLVLDVAEASSRLRGLYPPLYEDEWRDDWAAFRDPGPPQVDVVVTRSGTKGDDHHRRAWELLLADADLRAEYELRKAEGMDSVEKAAFFERVVAQLVRRSSLVR